MKRFIIISTLVLLIAGPGYSATVVKGFQLSTSVGLGAGFSTAPDGFKDGFDPGFGAIIDLAAQRSLVEMSVSVDYNFFFESTPEGTATDYDLVTDYTPEDINILTVFFNFKIKPIAKASFRPYILVGGGYYRTWTIDLDFVENTTGYQGGAGFEVDISKTQQLFIEVKQVIGRTRKVNPTAENITHVPVRVGLTFLF